MEYKVIQSRSLFSESKALDQLVQAVNEQISLGWEPLGGISTTEHGSLMQAMIKRR